MWDCATPATQSAAASRATKTIPSAPPSAISATPATQNEGGCEIVPRLPREVCQPVCTLVTVGVWQSCVWSYCVWKMVCARWLLTDGVWQSCVWSYCMWKMVCDKMVFDRWYVTKLCVKFVCVKFLYVKDGMWQDGIWQMVCDKVVCEVVCRMVVDSDRLCLTKLCVKDGVCKRRREEEEAEHPGYRIKTRTPHKVVGNWRNHQESQHNMSQNHEKHVHSI